MKLSNAIKKLKKVAGNIQIHERTDGTPWMATARFGSWLVEFLANGRWHDDADITCIRVRKQNDLDDSMSDYSAGSFRDNLKQAIESAQRLDGTA